MRISEILRENSEAATTVSGSIAAVAQPMGAVIQRWQTPKQAKYSNSVTEMPKGQKKNARR